MEVYFAVASEDHARSYKITLPFEIEAYEFYELPALIEEAVAKVVTAKGTRDMIRRAEAAGVEVWVDEGSDDG